MGTEIESSQSSRGFEKECKEIHDYWETRLSQLVKPLASKSKLERQQIRETYRVMYGEDITGLMISSGGGNKNGESKLASEALRLWMVDPHERDAIFAREALEHQKQGDVNYRALVEIFVGRKSSQVFLIDQAYFAKFGRKLDQDIINVEPSHPFQKILVALLASHRAHKVDTSQHVARCDAKRLYEAGEASSAASIEKAVVLEILTKRSIPQLKLTLSCYNHIYGHHYIKSLKKGHYSEFEDALKIVIKCMCNPPNYYAKELQRSIKGATRDKGALARVLLSRAEVDMGEIQKIFKDKYYGFELKDAISERVPSGDYRDFLVALATKSATCN